LPQHHPQHRQTNAVPSTSAPQRGGALRIVMPDGVTQLDPAQPLSIADFQLASLTYDTLVRYDASEAQMPIRPHLAKR
jgi:ABC-type transport system substrate-binding protein